MRILWIIFLLTQFIFSFELVFNVGRNPNSPFGVLHLSDENNFSCKELINDGKNHFECLVLGNVHSELKNQNFNFFDLEFIKNENATQRRGVFGFFYLTSASSYRRSHHSSWSLPAY